MIRKEHYERVVVWDRMNRYPELVHSTQVPQIDGLILHWSLRSAGMNADSALAAICGLYRMTGHLGRMHRSTESLAVWKLREGDRVACSVRLNQQEARAFLETWTMVVLPQIRSFEGLSPKLVDQDGGVTLPRTNPMRFPSMEPMYERLNPRCSRPGLTMTRQITGTSGPNKRSMVLTMLTARGLPFVGEE